MERLPHVLLRSEAVLFDGRSKCDADRQDGPNTPGMTGTKGFVVQSSGVGWQEDI
jgi:hypothetical protein